MENIVFENQDLFFFGLLLGVGLVLLIVSLIVRAKTGGKYEIRPGGSGFGPDSGGALAVRDRKDYQIQCCRCGN